MAMVRNDTLVESATRAARPIIAFMMVLFFFAALDRLNVGFAALTMNKDLGLTPSQFGFGNGLYILVHGLLEVPSNLMLLRFGPRRWIARIAVTWGLCATGAAMIVGPHSYYLFRVLVSAAAAGYFPAAITYIARWYPMAYRSRMNNLFLLGIPLTGTLASVFSAGCLALNGTLGLAGWQWLFILEGSPPIILGLLALRILPDGPADAQFLNREQKNALIETLAAEDADKHARFPVSIRTVFKSPVCWLLGFAYLGIAVGLSTLGFWLPQAVGSLGIKDPVMTGLLTAVPFMTGAAIMTITSWNSDRTQERTWHLLAMTLLAAASWLLFGYATSPVMGVIIIALAAGGTYGMLSVFWTLPGAYLSGAAAAPGFAMVSAIATVGGFAGPWLVGYLRQQSGGFALAFAAPAACILISGVLGVLVSRHLLRTGTHDLLEPIVS